MNNAEELYHQYGKQIYNLVYRMTGNKEDAQDITQETFIQAINGIGSFKGESKVHTWLYRIAKNNCLRFLEKKNRTLFISLEELTQQVSSPVADELSESEKSRYILQVKNGCLSGLIRCLPLQQRLVFIFHVLFNLPVEEAASVIEKSGNATRILIHRAKQNIREYMCRNCSLYDAANSCHCENLINFSLKQGWIGNDVPSCSHSEQVEAELTGLKRVVILYQSLQEQTPSEKFHQNMRQVIASKQDFLIFHDKKVK